jgi:hypothetical protein
MEDKFMTEEEASLQWKREEAKRWLGERWILHLNYSRKPRTSFFLDTWKSNRMADKSSALRIVNKIKERKA